MVSFSHLAEGTAARTWKDCGISELDVLDADQLFHTAQRLVVLAAHPDDETLGASGLMQEALRRNIDVDVILCTDGEASHPHSPTHTPEQLAQLRATEVSHAMQVLASSITTRAQITVHRLQLPDGALAQHSEQLQEVLIERVGSTRCVLASTYRADGHGDHEVLGEIAARVAHDLRLFHLEFPIWYWHWANPIEDGRWWHWNRLELDHATLHSKQQALAAHRSQTQPLSELPGDEVLLSAQTMEHFLWPGEIFRLTRPGEKDTAMTASVFEQLYRDRPDPWNYRDSHYEERKRSILLACLPREHYANILELGCSIGIQTAALADRCDGLLAVDSSPTALEQAAKETADLEHVRLQEHLLPGQWPQLENGSVDLVVISEIGYFLAADKLAELLDRSATALAPGGELLLCHWLHPIEGWPLNGQEVHRIAHRRGWEQLVLHQERNFLLEVLRKPGAEHG